MLILGLVWNIFWAPHHRPTNPPRKKFEAQFNGPNWQYLGLGFSDLYSGQNDSPKWIPNATPPVRFTMVRRSSEIAHKERSPTAALCGIRLRLAHRLCLPIAGMMQGCSRRSWQQFLQSSPALSASLKAVHPLPAGSPFARCCFFSCCLPQSWFPRVFSVVRSSTRVANFPLRSRSFSLLSIFLMLLDRTLQCMRLTTYGTHPALRSRESGTSCARARGVGRPSGEILLLISERNI